MPEDDAQRTLAATAAALTIMVKDLRTAALGVTERLDVLTSRANRQRLGIVLTGVGLVADLVLSVFMLAAYKQQAATSARLEAVVAQQSIVRGSVTCPILSYLIGSYDPRSRMGDARATAEQNLANQRHVYADVLHCSTPLVPPRTDLLLTPLTKPN